ncbi:uncharacterized protein ACR2FA_005841 isoform 2-T2 [Aphomia sociella]
MVAVFTFHQLVAGAGLATSARLKWDPSLYVALRELLPTEYRVLAGALAAASCSTLLLAHLGTAALLARTPLARRSMLFVYAFLMLLMVVSEVVLVYWATRRVIIWMASEEATILFEAVELRHEFQTIAKFFGRLHPLPDKLHNLMQEIEEDLPCNLYVAIAYVTAVVVLQPLSVVLAIMASRTSSGASRPTAGGAGDLSRSDSDVGNVSLTYSNKDPERPLLKTVYRNGRLQVV